MEETAAQTAAQTAETKEEVREVPPREAYATLGSLKNAAAPEAVKEFYTRQEALRFTRADLDADPQLLKALENSMLKW